MLRLICLFLVLSFAVTLSAQEDDLLTLTHDGIERTYSLYVPETYDEQEAAALVIVLHGAGDQGWRMRRALTFDALAEQYGAIVAYPDAVNRRWSYLDVPVGADDANAEDEDFLTVLIDAIGSAYQLDESRLYFVGYSNGGLMTMRMRCELDDRLAAVIAVGSTLTFGIAQTCLQAEPVPFMLVIGTRDAAFPFSGVMQVENGALYGSFSVPQTLSFMNSINGCADRADVEQVSTRESRVNVIRQAFTACDDESEVVFYALVDQGHDWPGLPIVTLQDGATGNMEQVMWEFLNTHQREP